MTTTTFTRTDAAEPAIRATKSAVKPSRTGSGRIVRVWGPALAVLAVIVGGWYLVSDVLLAPAQRFLLPAPDAVIRKGFLDPSIMSPPVPAPPVPSPPVPVPPLPPDCEPPEPV